MTREGIPEHIRMLVIDIDGTLLNPAGEITAQTRVAVQAAQEAGILVTLATARRYLNTRQIADELGLHIPLILYDGAMIVEHPRGTILHRETFPAAIAQQVTNRPYTALALAAGLAVALTWLGIATGFYTGYPSSVCISLLAFVSYVAVVGGNRVVEWRGQLRRSLLRG